MKVFKTIKRIFVFLTILIVLLAGVLLVYIENGSGIYLSDETKRRVTIEVRSAPKLPQDFLFFYNKVYPKSLEKGVWAWLFSQFISQSATTKCPCATLAHRSILYKNPLNGIESIIAHLTVSRHFEKVYTQTDCLNYLTHSSDFLRNINGIQTASKFYLNKEIEDLDDREIAELLARMENPLYFDREKHPWNLERKINLLLRQANYVEK